MGIDLVLLPDKVHQCDPPEAVSFAQASILDVVHFDAQSPVPDRSVLLKNVRVIVDVAGRAILGVCPNTQHALIMDLLGPMLQVRLEVLLETDSGFAFLKLYTVYVLRGL